MVNEQNICKVMNVNIDRTHYAQLPALRWMSPECMLSGRFNKENDIWAFGVLLWEIFSLGATPYADGLCVDLIA